MYRIRKIFKFEAAHVLDSSYSTCCQQIHGHSYLVELFFRSEKLNEDGMVVDFGKVKEQAQPFIDQFDHALIMSDKHLLPRGVNIIEVPYNPTAENMAHHFFEWLKPKVPSLFKVRFHETASGYAEFEGVG